MSEKQTGAPAFPFNSSQQIAGMTLRDYFAAQAMQGFVSADGYGGDSDSNIAFNAYALADAMLKARKS